MAKFSLPDGSPSRRVEAAVITQAELPYDVQLKSRRKRYMLAMSMRIPLLIAATVFYHHLWLSIPLLLISIPLPWMAVLIANDRPPRNRAARKVVPGVINYERALPPPQREVVDSE